MVYAPTCAIAWASQKRRITLGGKRFADGSMHEDGWAEISMSAFAHEGGITGGSGVKSQRFDEVYRSDGLVNWRRHRCADRGQRDPLRPLHRRRRRQVSADAAHPSTAGRSCRCARCCAGLAFVEERLDGFVGLSAERPRVFEGRQRRVETAAAASCYRFFDRYLISATVPNIRTAITRIDTSPTPSILEPPINPFTFRHQARYSSLKGSNILECMLRSNHWGKSLPRLFAGRWHAIARALVPATWLNSAARATS